MHQKAFDKCKNMFYCWKLIDYDISKMSINIVRIIKKCPKVNVVKLEVSTIECRKSRHQKSGTLHIRIHYVCIVCIQLFENTDNSVTGMGSDPDRSGLTALHCNWQMLK